MSSACPAEYEDLQMDADQVHFNSIFGTPLPLSLPREDDLIIGLDSMEFLLADLAVPGVPTLERLPFGPQPRQINNNKPRSSFSASTTPSPPLGPHLTPSVYHRTMSTQTSCTIATQTSPSLEQRSINLPQRKRSSTNKSAVTKSSRGRLNHQGGGGHLAGQTLFSPPPPGPRTATGRGRSAPRPRPPTATATNNNNNKSIKNGVHPPPVPPPPSTRPPSLHKSVTVPLLPSGSVASKSAPRSTARALAMKRKAPPEVPLEQASGRRTTPLYMNKSAASAAAGSTQVVVPSGGDGGKMNEEESLASVAPTPSHSSLSAVAGSGAGNRGATLQMRKSSVFKLSLTKTGNPPSRGTKAFTRATTAAAAGVATTPVAPLKNKLIKPTSNAAGVVVEGPLFSSTPAPLITINADLEEAPKKNTNTSHMLYLTRNTTDSAAAVSDENTKGNTTTTTNNTNSNGGGESSSASQQQNGCTSKTALASQTARPKGKLVRAHRAEVQILAYCADQGVTEELMVRRHYGNNADISKAFRRLVDADMVVKCSGEGRKGSPYRYVLTEAGEGLVEQAKKELEEDKIAREEEKMRE